VERLPLRIDDRLRHAIDGDLHEIAVISGDDECRRLTGTFSVRLARDLAFVVRVHSRAGIPLAVATVAADKGSEVFETSDLTFLGMEGYRHLSRAEARVVEGRVWTRRAFATATFRPAGNPQ
jgi:hypothetical protein